MTPAPNPPPRGAGPRVSELTRVLGSTYRRVDQAFGVSYVAIPSQDWMIVHVAASEAADYKARADAAEVALREMTEQRDRAWEAGRAEVIALVEAEMADRELRASAAGAAGCYASELMTSAGLSALRWVAETAAALAPPAETAAKEERT